MTTTAPDPTAAEPGDAESPTARGAQHGIVAWLTTTDHKKIGILYGLTSLAMALVGFGLSGIIRAQLARPDQQVVGFDTYNEVFTMHGTVMVYLFAVPFAFAVGNYLVPLMVGAPDMAFPRLNMLSYWLYLAGALIVLSGFLTSSGAADFGWFAYPPYAGQAGSPGIGGDLWLIGLLLTGASGILTALNLVATIVMLRAPGMTMFRMPILVWDMLLTSFMVLIAFPVLTSAQLMLLADRRLGAQFFVPEGGGLPILWQHLFWFFGHPEVYIVALPYFGIVTEIFPVFSRRPVFGYKGLVLASMAIAGLSTSVWAHHMFVTGDVYLPYFAVTTALIAVPTGIKFFDWMGTMWGGKLTFPPPMLFAVGFLVTFLLGGITGVVLSSPTLDFSLSDTYFVVAHFHYVMGGTVVFAVFAALYFWWPKLTGRMLDQRLGRWHFWMLVVGFNVTFLVMHRSGLEGMPRRVASYGEAEPYAAENLISSIGVLLVALSLVPFVWALVKSWRRPEFVGDDPWGGSTLEWLTTSPPPEHNFDWLPPIRSERPAYDWRHRDEWGVGALDPDDPWRRRERHDTRWAPLQRWRDDGTAAEPRAPDADGLDDGGPDQPEEADR
ncbi:MAG: cytochrome c oxidase subunit I [Acidimicrobiales bacterium]|nr:cytochrome c oxidase subunit I [Acidimicrobiales bacterium]